MAEVFGDTDKSAAVEVESNTMETDREVRTMTIFHRQHYTCCIQFLTNSVCNFLVLLIKICIFQLAKHQHVF